VASADLDSVLLTLIEKGLKARLRQLAVVILLLLDVIVLKPKIMLIFRLMEHLIRTSFQIWHQLLIWSS